MSGAGELTSLFLVNISQKFMSERVHWWTNFNGPLELLVLVFLREENSLLSEKVVVLQLWSKVELDAFSGSAGGHLDRIILGYTEQQKAAVLRSVGIVVQAQLS